jgi:gas vesicle protein
MGSIKIMLAAMAAGTLVGVLFAPAKGKTTRRRIAHQANTVADEVKNTFEEVADTLTQRFDAVKGDVIHLRKQFMH